MEKRLFDVDKYAGTKTWFHYDDQTDTSYLETIHDKSVTNAGLKMAQELRNDESYTKKGIKNEALHYAWIPDELLLKWHVEGINIHDVKSLIKQVNKPEYAYLKTTNLVHR